MSFLLFAQSHGLNVDYIKATDKIEHCGTHAKPKSSNGRYRFNGTDGWVMDWSIDTTVHFYGDKTVKTFTDADKKAWAENKRKEEQAEQRKYAEAAQRAADVLKFAKSKTHYYLNSKGFPDALGLVVELVG